MVGLEPPFNCSSPEPSCASVAKAGEARGLPQGSREGARPAPVARAVVPSPAFSPLTVGCGCGANPTRCCEAVARTFAPCHVLCAPAPAASRRKRSSSADCNFPQKLPQFQLLKGFVTSEFAC